MGVKVGGARLARFSPPSQPFPATASAEGRQFNGAPFPVTASAEGAQFNVPPSPDQEGRSKSPYSERPIRVEKASD